MKILTYNASEVPAGVFEEFESKTRRAIDNVDVCVGNWWDESKFATVHLNVGEWWTGEVLHLEDLSDQAQAWVKSVI